jgi:hypothetical protein
MPIADEIASARIDQMIGSLGRGIAQAQHELDLAGMRLAQSMAGLDEGSRVRLGKRSYSLLELGFTPTFYQFSETVLEIKIAIAITSSRESAQSSARSSSASYASAGWDGDSRVAAYASSVSASYSCKYQYSAEGSSLVRTKLVPVPSPALLNERIRTMIEAEQRVAAQAGEQGTGDA